MTKTTNEQWEYLFEIIQKSETKYTKARQQVLAFGARIGLEERQKLFQIRDQQATITWPPCHANPQYFADHRPLPAYGAKAAIL